MFLVQLVDFISGVSESEYSVVVTAEPWQRVFVGYVSDIPVAEELGDVVEDECDDEHDDDREVEEEAFEEHCHVRFRRGRRLYCAHCARINGTGHGVRRCSRERVSR